MIVIEKRRWMPDYDSEYVADELATVEVERMAMAAVLSDTVPRKPGAFIEHRGDRYNLARMKAKHFQTGAYRSK